MIERAKHRTRVLSLLERYPVVAIIGARQVGKSTLAREIASSVAERRAFFDLEDPRDLARLADSMLALEPLSGLVVLDEVQRLPEIFPVLRVLADRRENPARFLVLGSASPELLRQSSESLAGRIAYHELPGLALHEIGNESISRLWLRGGFPDSYLSSDDAASLTWRRNFVRTFVERDLPQLGVTISSTTTRRFWTMVAHYHGQIWNASEFARSFGVSDTTIRRYLDTLTSALVLRQLRPWFENLKKRQVKSPKVYIADPGILHALLNLPGLDDVESHPKLGASWEGFVLNEIISTLDAEPEECFFWATHTGAEIDLLVVRGRVRRGFEIKRTTSPSVTPSMRSALHDLKLDRIDVIHAGPDSFPLADRVHATSVHRLLTDLV
ncbi:MAG: ATP-binding protein [Spirochaetaceae bacterium]|nr:MAG: ATP-binding protein [Spirochaetaceae bacterium]